MLRVGSKLRMLNPDDPKDAALMEYQPQEWTSLTIP